MKTLLLAVLTCTVATFSYGQSFIALLDGAQDGGGGRQGTGTVSMTLTGNTLSFSGAYGGLSTNVTLAHIHGPAPVGSPAGVVYNLITLGILTGQGTTSGTLSGSFNMVAAPAGTSYTTIQQQINDLNAGLWYINIHSVTFGGGEIRGQINLIPEPSSFALLGLGAGTLLYRLRRRRQSTF